MAHPPHRYAVCFWGSLQNAALLNDGASCSVTLNSTVELTHDSLRLTDKVSLTVARYVSTALSSVEGIQLRGQRGSPLFSAISPSTNCENSPPVI